MLQILLSLMGGSRNLTHPKWGDHEISPILNGGITKSQAFFLGGDRKIYGVNFAQIFIPAPLPDLMRTPLLLNVF